METRNPYAFLTFGLGPRSCIGLRFATFFMKLALSEIVTKFRLVPGPSMPKTLEVDPASQSSNNKGGVWFKLESREV